MHVRGSREGWATRFFGRAITFIMAFVNAVTQSRKDHTFFALLRPSFRPLASFGKRRGGSRSAVEDLTSPKCEVLQLAHCGR